MRLALPEPVETRDVPMDDGAVIRIRRHGNLSASRVVLSHGNGCAVDGYFPFWGLLLADFEVVVFDFRHYGGNPPHRGRHDFRRFIRDLGPVYDAVDREFGRKPQVGAFHSMSARMNLKFALQADWRFDALVVFDPPMVPPRGHPLHEMQIDNERRLWTWAESRRSEFGDPEELAAHFAASRMLAGWVDGAYDLMARSVLRRDGGSGKWTLACPPRLEGRIYRENARLRMWPRADAFPGPVMLVASDPDGPVPSTPSHSARALRDERGWRCEILPGAGHFMQLQKPEACRDLMLAFLDGIGFR